MWIIMYLCGMEENLSLALKESARAHGMCDRWNSKWKGDETQDALIDMMYRGMDFCLTHHWPSNAFIKENFDPDTLRRRGVFVDDIYSAVNPRESLALGTSAVTLRFNGWSLGFVYARDEASVMITAKNCSNVFVHAFDKCFIDVNSISDRAEVVVFKHSEDVKVSGPARVKEDYGYLR